MVFNKLINSELVRYGQVGIALNSSTYFLYLILTGLSLTPFFTLLITYPLGYLVSYFAHKDYTFRRIQRYKDKGKFTLYVALQLIGMALNLIILFSLTSYLGMPHQIAQLLALPVVSLFLFSSMKTFIF